LTEVVQSITISFGDMFEYQYQICKIQQTSRKGMQPLVSNSMVKWILSCTAFIWEKNSLVVRLDMQYS